MIDKITKVEKLGLAARVESLRTDESGGARHHTKIAAVLKSEGVEGCGANAIRTYLKKLDKQRKPHAEQAIKESVAPHAISSMEILERLEQQLFQKVVSTGDTDEKLVPCATGARALLDVIKTKMGMLGIRLSDPDDPTRDIREELESLRRRATRVGLPTGGGQPGTPSGTLPN